MPSASPTPLSAAAPTLPPKSACPAPSEGSSNAKMAAASMMPAENDINAVSCSLLTRCTRNTGKAPTAVATAASNDACTPAAIALPLSAAIHQARVGAQKVLSAAKPAITSRPAPRASKALRSACAGTFRSNSCNWAQTGRTCWIRVAMGFLWMVSGLASLTKPIDSGQSMLTIEGIGSQDKKRGTGCPAPLSGSRQPPQLKNDFAFSNQPLSFGLCLWPPFLNDSSSSLSSLRWCSVSLIGVSTATWQYRSPG